MIAENLDIIRDRMRVAAEKAGRSANDVRLVAVSKTHGPEMIHEAFHAGQRCFGESRVQEARAKIPQSPGAASWHFIGHLQANKVRHALPLFELIHSVDTLEIAQVIQRIAGEMGLRPAVLLEVNVAGESSKFGFSPDALKSVIEPLLAMDRLEIRGLMTIPPPVSQPEDARPFFQRLRDLRDVLQDEYCVGLPELSMGMSSDFEAAIAEGATLVRVGSAIFGERQAKE